MKIIWTPNPLRSKVHLDETEKPWFKELIRTQQMRWKLYEVKFCLNGKMYNDDPDNLNGRNGKDYSREAGIKRALEAVTDFEEEVNKRTEELFESYLEDLVDLHMGDCTCIPCSCMKCHAESLMNIDTIEGLGKHEANSIETAFRTYSEEEDRTFAEALEYLKTTKSKDEEYPNWGDKDPSPHFERWDAERLRAYEWLKKYGETHSFS